MSMIKVGTHYYHDVRPKDYTVALRNDIENRRAANAGRSFGTSSWLGDGWEVDPPDIEIERIRSGGWYRATWHFGQDDERLTFLIAAVGHFPIREEGHFQVLGTSTPAKSVGDRLSKAIYGKPGQVRVELDRP